jgi:hypothetical protein
MRARAGIGLLLATSILAAAGAAPVQAAERVAQIATFGSLAQPNDIAVDQADGTVFVADIATKAVHVYVRKGATEYEQAAEITGAQTPEHGFVFASQEPAPIAVDPTTRALYVADIDNHVVDRFKRNGPDEYAYECQITGFHAGCHPNLSGEEGTPEPHFGETAGVTVDSHGDLYVADFGHNTIYEFGPGSEDIAAIARELTLTKEPANLAIDSAGHLYVNKFDGPVGVLTVEPSTGAILSEHERFAGTGGYRGVAVDPAGNDLYAAQTSSGETELQRYESSGARLPFATPPGIDSEGLAVYGAAGDLYVSDSNGEDVRVFGPVTVPDVGGCELPSPLSATTATLRSSVNPLSTIEASYRFQYGTSTAYGSETAPTPVEGSATLAAEAPVEELEPGTIYHCRIVATNNSGALNEGPDGTFATPPLPPEISASAVTGVTAEGALFTGAVNPGNGQTSYHFAYGESEGEYTHTLPAIAIGSGRAPVAVEQASETLTPGTTYHYALITSNSAETVTGPDHTFTTPTAASEPTTPPTAITGAITSLTQTTASVTGTTDTAGLPATYTFELGTTTSTYPTHIYGTISAGGGGGETPLAASVSGLAPGTTYHYRLTVTDQAGSTTGIDQTFTTPGFPPTILQPPTPLLIPFTPPAAIPAHKPSSPPLSRAQRLQKALQACKGKPRHKRAACEREARKRYGSHAKRSKRPRA